MTELIFKREVIANKALCRALGVTAFIILTALGAFVRLPLPFTPVPLTLQTFFVLCSGAFLGKRLGVASQFGYLSLGVMGFPIFANAGYGAAYLFGPTAGYIFGFILASFFIGGAAKRGEDNFFLTLSLFCLADLIILSCGMLWLRVIFGYPLTRLLGIGFLPFVAGDFLKASAACLVYLKLKSRIREIF